MNRLAQTRALNAICRYLESMTGNCWSFVRFGENVTFYRDAQFNHTRTLAELGL